MAQDDISPLSLLSSAGSWSLADDASLLSAMQQLSLNISSQAKQLLDKMDQLAINTALAQTRLQTTTNNFMLLSNIKFIEARVYEDSEVESKNEVETNVSEKEQSLNEGDATTQALKHGLNVINTAFEKVEINDSDSDSDVEDEKLISVLQPKNPYHIRSLPAIIGTEAWVDDDKIGLIEEEIEDESSSSESESEEISPEKKEDSEYSESDTEKVEKQKSQITNVQTMEESDSVSDFSDDEELFKPKQATSEVNHQARDNKSESEGEEDQVKSRTPTSSDNTGSTFANELSSKLGLGISKQTTENDQGISDSSEDEPEAKEKPKPKKIVKSPPKKSVLFDSSDSDDDLFSPKPKSSPLKHEANKKPSNDTEYEEMSNTKKLPPLPPPSQAKPKSVIEEPGLVDLASNKLPKTVTTSASRSLVSDDESESDDDFFSPIKSNTIVQDNKGEKQVTVAEKLPNKEKSLFGDSSEEDEIFSNIKVNSFKEDSVTEAKTEKKNIFDDSDDSDDLFADLMANKKKSKLPPVPAASSKPMLSRETGDTETSELKSESKQVTEINPALEKTGESESASKVKKPIGGVSLFGNFDPRNLKKSTQSSEDDDETGRDEEDNDGNSRDKKEFIPSPVPLTTTMPTENTHDQDTDKFISHKLSSETDKIKIPPPIPPSELKPKSNEEIKVDSAQDKPNEGESVTKLKKPMGGVSMFGGFDPTKMIKGAPNDKDDKERDVVPVEIKEQSPETLITLTKSRPKMKGGRKPPTRAGRKNAVESSNALTFDVIDGPVNSEVKDATQDSASISEDKKHKTPIGGVSMLAGLNPAQLLKSRNNSKIDKLENSVEDKNTSDTERITIDGEMTNPSLKSKEKEMSVGPKDMENVKDKPPQTNSAVASNDYEEVMSAENEGAEGLPGSTPTLLSNDNVEAISFEPPPMENVNEKLDRKNNLFGFDDTDSDDDMFSNIPSSSKNLIKTDPLANLFDDEDSDDDLFSSLTKKS